MILLNNVQEGNFTQIQNFFLQRTNEQIIKEQNEKDEEGRTALMHAAIGGNLRITKLLCQKDKIDITAFNAQDNSGMTAVMHAAKLGHSDILKSLYNIPGKLTDETNKQNFSYVTKNYLSGLNALMIAIVNGHVDCLELLYCKEIQYIINHQDSENRTAIMLALDRVRDEKIFGNKEGIENARNGLDELFKIVEIVFNDKDEKYSNLRYDNRLDLTIQDKDRCNTFAHAKEAECEIELLNFISSIPISLIIPDLYFHELSESEEDDEQKSIESSKEEDDEQMSIDSSETDSIIFDSTLSITIESDGESCYTSSPQSYSMNIESDWESSSISSLQSYSMTSESDRELCTSKSQSPAVSPKRSEELSLCLQEMIIEKVNGKLFLR